MKKSNFSFPWIRPLLHVYFINFLKFLYTYIHVFFTKKYMYNCQNFYVKMKFIFNKNIDDYPWKYTNFHVFSWQKQDL